MLQRRAGRLRGRDGPRRALRQRRRSARARRRSSCSTTSPPNRIDLEEVAELVEGAAQVCRAAGCVLLGGETAELPGIYREGELDFAGTCVGLVERDA